MIIKNRLALIAFPNLHTYILAKAFSNLDSGHNLVFNYVITRLECIILTKTTKKIKISKFLSFRLRIWLSENILKQWLKALFLGEGNCSTMKKKKLL